MAVLCQPNPPRTVSHLCICCCARLLLEFFCKGLIIEEGPRIVELVVPRPLKVVHALKHIVELLIAYQTQDGGLDARAVRVVGCVVIAFDSSQRFRGLSRCCTS